MRERIELSGLARFAYVAKADSVSGVTISNFRTRDFSIIIIYANIQVNVSPRVR